MKKWPNLKQMKFYSGTVKTRKILEFALKPQKYAYFPRKGTNSHGKVVIYRAKVPLKAIKMRLDAGHRAMHRQLATSSIHRANRPPHAIKDFPSKPVLEGHFGSSLSLRLCLLCAVLWKPFPSGAGACGLSELTGRCLRPRRPDRRPRNSSS